MAAHFSCLSTLRLTDSFGVTGKASAMQLTSVGVPGIIPIRYSRAVSMASSGMPSKPTKNSVQIPWASVGELAFLPRVTMVEVESVSR